jgi:hypothetical protein
MAATTHSRTEQDQSHPTEDEREIGCITWYDVRISDVEHWVEDGDYVFRSREFDVIAGAPSLDEAVQKFVQETRHYGQYLADLEDPGENETEQFQVLAPRIIEVAERLESEVAKQRRRINIPIGRRHRRGDHSSWHPRSPAPRNSSQPSAA